MSDARLRQHPSERFAVDEKFYDLDDAFRRLPKESSAAQEHIQKTLYRRGPCTTAIFALAPHARLQKHILEGEAILHVLAGEIHVRTDAAEYLLGPNHILLLAPGVPHDLTANEDSRLVMHIILSTGA